MQSNRRSRRNILIQMRKYLKNRAEKALLKSACSSQITESEMIENYKSKNVGAKKYIQHPTVKNCLIEINC